MDFYSEVKRDDFPDGIADFVDVVGVDVCMEIVDYCGGGMIYFPSKRSVIRNARNRVIKSEFNGGNFRELANRFEISEMQVRNIVKNQ
ncbi:Mor transcription activator family protein [Faecalimicrobium dakarense]|uniref:Mor transcription activator family protein n=1 Tax=Faecalimicrobium dakarense TaxID=1301100 RepID=UPI0004B82E4B|nr:Mor transcription activator family protein [[Clostridium] dakarense]